MVIFGATYARFPSYRASKAGAYERRSSAGAGKSTSGDSQALDDAAHVGGESREVMEKGSSGGGDEWIHGAGLERRWWVELGKR